MPADKSSRESHFPSIEKKYGEPMKYWFAVMKKLEGKKYPEQVAHLKENYGFSQAHANALVMFSRGSTSTKRFEKPADYYKTIKPEQVKTVKKIFKVIQTKYPKLELVIAWNQPMLRIGTSYVFGISVAKNHILMAPWSKAALKKMKPAMEDLDVNMKTIGIPNDWKVDSKLLLDLVKIRLSEIK
jgi:uncharacterized protein YdhG (YjbR/CyaY superfamily)